MLYHHLKAAATKVVSVCFVTLQDCVGSRDDPNSGMLDIILITGGVFIAWWIYTMRLPKSFPPGPRFPLPIIGDSYRMDAGSLTTTVKSMRKKYGDVFGFYLTSNLKVVFVCDPDLLNEVAFSDDFTGRRNMEVAHRIRGGVSLGGDLPGVLFSSNQTWVEQRRFCLSTLRDFGFGKQSMEEFINEELERFVEYLEIKSSGGKNSIYPKDVLSVSVVNSLWRMINGTTFENDDPRLHDLTDKNHYFTAEVSKVATQAAMQYRFLEEVLERTGLTHMNAAFGGLIKVAKESMKSHVEEFDPSNKPGDFIEAYLAKVHSETDSRSSFHGKSGMLNLTSNLADLFFAGIETTTTTLTWAMYFMIKYPDLQKKVQDELDENVGRDRSPELSDRANTPFIEAVLLETQRRGNVLPLAVPHHSPINKTTKIGKYEIPPGTDVLFAIGEVYNDPEIFENPDEFNPNRFIEKGEFKPHPKVIPFGIGKRRCLGEILAKAQLYLYFTRILQLYNVEPRSPLDDKPDEGFVVSPRRFEVAFVPRYP